MAVISVTYRCDWPGCKAILTCPPNWLADHGWEMRGDMSMSMASGLPTLTVCREHSHKTTAQIKMEFHRKLAEADFVREWGFLL